MRLRPYNNPIRRGYFPRSLSTGRQQYPAAPLPRDAGGLALTAPTESEVVERARVLHGEAFAAQVAAEAAERGGVK